MNTIGIVVTSAAGKVNLLDDWLPPQEVLQLAAEAGYDPHEMIEEIVDWYEGGLVPVSDAA
jgi:hypothetical protein